MTRSIVESHVHIAAYGEALSIPDASGCGSLAELLDLVARVRDGGRAFIRIAGARPEAWPEARWPTPDELELVTRDVPAVIMSFDRHSACADRRSLALAGLRAGQTVGSTGLVDRGADGESSGLLLEEAAYAAWGLAPEPDASERRAMVRLALGRLAALGYREAHDMHAQAWLGPLLAELERDGDLPLDVRLYAPIDALREIAAGRRTWESDRVRLAGGKVYSDGALNSRTAWMLDPYHDPLPGMVHGKPLVTDDSLDGAIGLAEEVGVHLAIHAIGDAAVRAVLDAIDRNRPSVGGYRIEHAELIDEADVPRFADMEVICSPQACHLLADMETLWRRLPHRLDRVLPLRDLIDSGCEPGRLLVFGSDAPIVDPDPRDSITGATLRRRPDVAEARAIAPMQAITQEEAWACFGVEETA